MTGSAEHIFDRHASDPMHAPARLRTWVVGAYTEVFYGRV